MGDQPSGTVTFLFTDIEGSTRLWQEHPEEMRAALARHDELIRSEVEGRRGYVVKTTGDGFHAAFADPVAAIETAIDIQRVLGDEDWELPAPVRVRIGIHSGLAELRDGDYYGTAVNKAARIMSVAHGEQVLVSLSTEELVSDGLPGDLALLDLGEQRLRDLSRPERIFQLVAPALRREFAPIRTLDAFPGNLPLQVSSFVGRHDELVALSAALQTDRLVTLTGVGGVGKTRVAVQLAAELLQRFPDGAWLFELAAVSDADSMVQLIATALGVAPRPGLTIQDAVIDSLRVRHALVVLDNCEHLLDPAGRFAERVLHECEHVRIVATSREALGIAGECVLPLRSMAVPTDALTPDAVEGSDAGRLFAERATWARPGFVIDATNAASVGEICRRLDGIPLAIELAAARLVAMTPTEIAGLLDERFRLLTGGRRAAVERHRTLRATVEWSYGSLEPVERLVFDRLGVFAGSFDSTAAAAVARGEELETWDVVDALASLAMKSMLVAEPGLADTTRYQMLETLRQYADEQLDHAGRADEFRRRHAQHYADVAAAAGEGLLGSEELMWRPRVNADRENLRAATYWALDRDDEDDSLLALRIIAALAWESVNDPPGGIGAWAERALDIAIPSAAPECARVIGAAAYQASYLARHDIVQSRAAILLGDELDIGSITSGLPAFAIFSALYQEGRRIEAAQLGLDAIRRLEHTQTDAFALVMFHLAVAYVAVDEGDLEVGRAEADLGLHLAREMDNPSALASAFYAVGRATEHDDPATSLDACAQAVALGKAGANQLMVGPALIQIARLRCRMNARVEALDALHEGITYSKYVGYRPLVVQIMGPVADTLLQLGEVTSGIVIAGSLLHGSLDTISVPPEDPELQQNLDRVRQALDEQQYERLIESGAAMSYEEIVEFALERVARKDR
jgi:predicted ATPase/class 3 adenylate cyclase